MSIFLKGIRKPRGDTVEINLGGAPRVLGPFSFTFDTPNLESGVKLYTPIVDDILMDAWIEIDVAFDGTTPQADLGTFGGIFESNDYGLFGGMNSPVDLTKADYESAGPGILQGATSAIATGLVLAGSLYAGAANIYQRVAPSKFIAAHPVLLVVSQNGLKGGPAIDSTQGEGEVYLVVATPSKQ